MKKSFSIHGRIAALPLLLLALSTFTSCGKKKTAVTSENSLHIQLSDSGNSEITDYPQTHSFTNKKILVLFGYDFNSEDFTQKVMSNLESHYGLCTENDSAEDGGIIFALRFPQDFKRGGRSHATELYSILSNPEYDFGGILLLGAPEYTHLALARNQDDWDQEVPYPVIALFPQDDGLGIESTCDFIIDKSQTAKLADENISMDMENHQDSNDDFALSQLSLIYSAIEYIKLSDFSLQELKEPKSHVARLLEGKKFHNYADPETGLKSINHFVAE